MIMIGMKAFGTELVDTDITSPADYLLQSDVVGIRKPNSPLEVLPEVISIPVYPNAGEYSPGSFTTGPEFSVKVSSHVFVDMVLDFGKQVKIPCIKWVRRCIPGMGLKQAKDLVDYICDKKQGDWQ